MKKKILMISGSPRSNGDGAKILKELELNFRDNAEVESEYLFIKDYNIEACRGCLVCRKKNDEKCPVKDDMSKIKEKFIKADGFVFITPVYIRMISAPMKQLFDRLSFWLHKPVHAGKPALLLSTTTFPVSSGCLEYLKIPVGNMGMHIVDSIGISSAAFKNKNEYKDKILKKLNQYSKDYINVLTSTEKPKPSVVELFIFNKWKHKAQYTIGYMTPVIFSFGKIRNFLKKIIFIPLKSILF